VRFYLGRCLVVLLCLSSLSSRFCPEIIYLEKYNLDHIRMFISGRIRTGVCVKAAFSRSFFPTYCNLKLYFRSNQGGVEWSY